MKVVAIGSQKGGVSKTTLSQCLAIEALKEGRRAAIVDLDPQGSCAKWGARRVAKKIQVPVVVHAATRPVMEVVGELEAKGAQFVVIDTPPLVTPTFHAALEASHSVIIVTRPNPMDIDAMVGTWEIVRRLPSLKTIGVITQTPPGGRAKALSLALSRIKKLQIPVCETALSYSLSYPYAQAEALGPQEREPSSKARAELAELWGELKRANIV